MSNLLYLGLAIVLSIIGSLILYYRHRRPRSLESGIEDFSKELQALAPDQRPPRALRTAPRAPRPGRRRG